MSQALLFLAKSHLFFFSVSKLCLQLPWCAAIMFQTWEFWHCAELLITHPNVTGKQTNSFCLVRIKVFVNQYLCFIWVGEVFLSCSDVTDLHSLRLKSKIMGSYYPGTLLCKTHPFYDTNTVELLVDEEVNSLGDFIPITNQMNKII